MDPELKRTRLYEWHVAHGGRMVPFAGWELPVRYDRGVIEEHRLVRRSVGLFDIDHMGQFTVKGPQGLEFLQNLVTSDLASLAVGASRYGLLCRPAGGVIDDVFVYRRPDDWFVVVNASNREKDFRWLVDHVPGPGVRVTDVSDQVYMVAVQGPRSFELLGPLADHDLGTLPRFGARFTRVAGVEVFVGRTGYTGEDGVELFFAPDRAVELWETLLASGADRGIEVAAIGLGARDSLRFEPGYSLYGHEITEDITPLEANLGWACDLSKPFVGREALVAQKARGLQRKLVAFELSEAGVAREGCPVWAPDGTPLGAVVAGIFAPTVGKSCGHAFVPPAYATPGTPLSIVIRDQPKAALVVRRPIYQRSLP
jgi:glycine cleavage system T protein